MERSSKEKPVALIVGGSSSAVRREAAELLRFGYELRAFDTAWDALAIFGEAMPQVAVIGSLPQTPCLGLLLDDLKRYDVPIVRPGESRLSTFGSTSRGHAGHARA